MYGKMIRYGSILLFTLVLLLGLWQAALFSGRQGAVSEVSARVISVENDLQTFGFVQEGTQHVTAEICEGPLKGRMIQGYNHVQAKTGTRSYRPARRHCPVCRKTRCKQ